MSTTINFNQWDSAPAQTPTASPRKKRGTDLWEFHEYQPPVSAPSQTVTAVLPNPHQLAVAYSTQDYYLNQEYPVPTQTVTNVPNPQQVAVAYSTQDYYLNQEYPAPSQTVTAVPNPHQLAVAYSTQDYYLNQEYSAPSQTVTNVPNPQQLAVAYPTQDYYLNQEYSAPSQTMTAVPNPQQVQEVLQPPLEVQGQTERDASATFSYAKTIWIEIDDETLKKLKSHGVTKVQQWAGKSLHQVFNGSQKIMSLEDAKMINANVPEPIIPTTLPKVKVVYFTVDPIIRERLKPISASMITPLLERIGVNEENFWYLKLYTDSVQTKHAEEYNEYFRQHNLGANTQNTGVFDLERILNLGNDEPIETTKKLEALIKFEPEHLKKLTDIRIEAKHPKKSMERSKNDYSLYRVFEKNFFRFRKDTKTISLKNAILINKISGDEIFKINEEAVQKYSIHQGQVKELESVLEGGNRHNKIRTLMRAIKYGKRNFVTVQEAKVLNAHLKTNPFGFASYLSSATQEAEDAFKQLSKDAFEDAFKQLSDLPTHARGKKRKSRGKKRKSTTSSEDPATLRSKKRRTQADDQQIPLNVNQGSFQELQTPVVAFNASVTLPQESIISPETTVMPEEFNSPVGSNAFAETNQNDSSSALFSPSELFQEFNGFEPDEVNDGKNSILDSSDWTFLDSISEDFNQ